ncbi:hypothetical protein NQZ68_000813 [Dissostichus eleginoides]|nr:hypothetical protein NQZ68_000813 [Dissostichus eleginoides]
MKPLGTFDSVGRDADSSHLQLRVSVNSPLPNNRNTNIKVTNNALGRASTHEVLLVIEMRVGGTMDDGQQRALVTVLFIPEKKTGGGQGEDFPTSGVQ